MARRISVTLPDPVADRLAEIARRELRGTRDQATVLLTDAVKRAERAADRRWTGETKADR
ncbi:MAG TPA: hypothetical protein VE011_09775 [Candidatus Dormibacteraeota bacterium]|nr:hypothetical protein [Candidatus Dormibacteraeota bacterium]